MTGAVLRAATLLGAVSLATGAGAAAGWWAWATDSIETAVPPRARHAPADAARPKAVDTHEARSGAGTHSPPL